MAYSEKNQLPNICPSLFEGLFFILEELRDNIKEMHLFGYTQPLSHCFLFILKHSAQPKHRDTRTTNVHFFLQEIRCFLVARVW